MNEKVVAEENRNENPQKKGFGAWLDRTFKLSANGTNVRTEVFAGLTTFFAMCYIVIVNPNQITGFYFTRYLERRIRRRTSCYRYRHAFNGFPC